MTVISTYAAQVKPGRFQDALELLRLAAKPLANHGARNVRVSRSATGETYGAVVMSLEFDDNESHGTWYDKVMADDEIVGLLARADSADSPYLNETVSINHEIPIEGPKEHGPVIEATIAKPLPGREEDAINLCSRVAKLVGRHGAVGCRLLRTTLGGLQTGNFVLVTEYASTAAMGKTADALATDPEGVALVADASGAGSPGTVISQGTYYEITL